MIITLKQHEIETALSTYLGQRGLSGNTQFSFSAGRKAGSGLSAEIRIDEPEVSAAEAQAEAAGDAPAATTPEVPAEPEAKAATEETPAAPVAPVVSLFGG